MTFPQPMPPAKSTSPLRLRADDVAFILTVAVAIVPALSSGRLPSAHRWGLLVCGFAFIGVGLLDPQGSSVSRPALRLAGYFAVQTLLLAGVLTFTRLHGMSVLAAFPLVAQAVGCLRPVAAAIFVTGLYAAIVGSSYFLPGNKQILASAASVLAGFAFVIVFTRVALREKTARAEAERLSGELSEANAQLRAQASKIEELAMSRERNRVAREIHDSLGHALTTIAVQLEAAGAMHATDPQRALGAVNKAHALAHEALGDVRSSVASLREESVRPLVERIHQLTTCDAHLQVRFDVLGTPRPLRADTEHGLFRTAQEGLTNARRHALATAVIVTLDYRTPERVVLSVVDNGNGTSTPKDGYGLTGLRERAALLGGLLVAENQPGGGFMLRMELPA